MITWVKTITVISSDGDEFEIAINVAEQSKLIKSMLNDVSVSGSKVPLYNVNSVTLAKVIEYCQKHVDHEAAANDGATNNASDGMEELKKWDDEFLKAHKCDLLFDIILAANYLEITGLLDSSCQAVADMIKGKTPEQIRHIFNIKNDFTPEEEEQIRRENQWVFDD